MNYFKHYSNLIRKAKKRQQLLGYKEVHHIIPKCIMKLRNKSKKYTNSKWNKVPLTAQEHFIAHCLLLKIAENYYGKKHQITIKLLYALSKFQQVQYDRTKQTSKYYSEKMKELSAIKSQKLKGRIFSGKTKLKMSKSAKIRCKNIPISKKCTFLGKTHTEKFKQKMSLIHSNKKVSLETRKKMSNHVKTKSHREKISKTLTGRKNLATSKKISYKGIMYNSYREASSKTGISYHLLRKFKD